MSKGNESAANVIAMAAGLDAGRRRIAELETALRTAEERVATLGQR